MVTKPINVGFDTVLCVASMFLWNGMCLDYYCSGCWEIKTSGLVQMVFSFREVEL